MYDDVLVPTDGSEGARRAFDHALDLAETYGSTIHGLNAVDPAYATDAGTGQVIEAMREEGNRTVTEMDDRAESEGIAAVTAVRTGSPHGVILDYVEENDVDLVVMGTRGRTGLRRYLLGSVAEKVVRLSEVPVFTVPGGSATDE